MVPPPSLENDILGILDRPMSPLEVRQALEAKGISPWEQDLRDAIWRLIHERDVNLRPDRKIEKAPKDDWYEYDL